ncbi:MAG TPA: VOC family protein [Rariglobus sp.]|nr:VOC family protein [Rariglobus sp.]HTL69547.1 VOC family protein [Lacunisphaera sp.]
MTKLTPFLLFDGNCAEAMAFYQSCLGGELSLTRISDTPMKAQVSAGQQHKVAHAHLRSGDIEFSATDWMHPTRTPRVGNTVCLYVDGGTYAELRSVFDRLAAGADQALLDDLRDLPFGSYGHLADKYGVHWFFRGEKKPDA